VKYILFWDKGNSNGKLDKAITLTANLEHTIEIMEPSKDYRFLVQAQNRCGTGDKSDEAEGSTKTAPARM